MPRTHSLKDHHHQQDDVRFNPLQFTVADLIGLHPYTRTDFSSTGLVKQTRDELGRLTDYTYDAAGRQTAVQLPQTEIVADDAATVTSGRPTSITIYDDNGNVVEKEDARQNKWNYVYGHTEQAGARTPTCRRQI